VGDHLAEPGGSRQARGRLQDIRGAVTQQRIGQPADRHQLDAGGAPGGFQQLREEGKPARSARQSCREISIPIGR